MIIEGAYIVDARDDVYAVKGVLHPIGKVVAFPKYVKNNKNGYTKIETLQESIKYLNTEAREYLTYDRHMGTIIPAIPLEKIRNEIKPSWRITERKNKATKTAIAFYNMLSEYLDIEDSGGFTGSILLGLSTDYSDVDAVIYGMEKSREVYDALTQLREEKILNPLTGSYSHRFLEARIDTSEARQHWEKIEKRKILTGIYDGVVYNMKLVPLPSEFWEKYGDREVKTIGETEIECEIIDDSLGIFTPNKYKVETVNVIKGREEAWHVEEITSARSRYAEHAKRGEKIRLRGRLEEVNHRGRKYHRVFIGNNQLDYMINIKEEKK